MNIGEKTKSNRTQISPRTKAKLDENLELLVADIKKLYGVTSEPESAEEQRLRFMLYSGLSWTAADVLDQAVADGYVSSAPGVL